jgi:hypothetical protein
MPTVAASVVLVANAYARPSGQAQKELNPKRDARLPETSFKPWTGDFARLQGRVRKEARARAGR